MASYRVLVVAPETDLTLVRDEVTAVVNSLGANILQGFVTADMVLNKVTEGWNVLWFMTHGTEEGILLSDGPLNASALTTLARAADAGLVVLNTCQSINVAMQVYNELQVSVVCTLSNVPDREAFFTGKLLAKELAKGKSYLDAYLDSKPGQTERYIFLQGRYKEKEQAVAVSSNLHSSGSSQNKGDLQDAIRRLDALVSGDSTWGQQGLVHIVRELLEKMEKVGRDILVLRMGMIGLLILNFIVLVTVLSILFAR
jgi:hypothetical protein